ncbi:sugar transferase [Kocuria palustris]|nr:sugar transferase [Kocuria palustris]MBN6757301.1 sugar transferase [Kocuria palustris]MBN6762329.1 sugar transferase [Kocuria palustris]MBN6781811.1 sugar transferase [Kocuria palustris]MBN6798295.1 sugar transferase [Kocuria palustris]
MPGAVGGLLDHEVQQDLGQVGGEGESAVLIIDDGRVDPPLGQRGQSPHGIRAVADHPARAHDPVLRPGAHRALPGRLGLAVDGQRGHGVLGCVLLIQRQGAVEDAVGRHVRQGDVVIAGRLLVRPGLTGLWQVSGRSNLSWEDSVRLDLLYVEQWSMVQDLLILVKTVRAVVTARGAY